MIDCDVLIVGGGPVGLYLATELGQRGIRVEVFDAKPGTSLHPAANANSARTMEHFRRVGIASAVRALGLPDDYEPDVAYCTSIIGKELARLRQPASGSAVEWARKYSFMWPTPEPPHRCSQLYIEPVLLEAARANQSCRVHFGALVTSVKQDVDSVTATVRFDAAPGREAGIQTVRARYLVGCDGPRSFVREALDVTYEGTAGQKRAFMGGRMDAVYFYAPDIYTLSPHKPAWQYWTFSPKQRALVIAVDGKGHFIMNVQLQDREEPGDEFIRSRIVEAVGADVPFEIKSRSRWTAGFALVAARFSVGRIFLAGDSAHLFTPTGGLGYNTGIDDAANLAWKLEALVKGTGGDTLARSYEIERKPVALRNTAFARTFADSIGHMNPPPEAFMPGDAGEEARAALGKYLAFHAAHEFEIPGVHLGVRYEASPLISVEEGFAPPDSANLYVPCARPGHRVPHVWLADGTSLFDRFGRGFTLLCTSPRMDQSDWATRLEKMERVLPQLSVTTVDDRSLAALCEANFVLIRPDLHVAWRGATLDDAFEAAAYRAMGYDHPTEKVGESGKTNHPAEFVRTAPAEETEPSR